MDGVMIRVKGAPKTLMPGEYFAGDPQGPLTEAWKVDYVTAAAATVECVFGRGKGRRIQVATSRVGHRFLTQEEVDQAEEIWATETATLEDEHCCPNCWPGEKGQAAWGRDPQCPDHQPSAEAIRQTRHGKRRARVEEKPEDIEKVLALRAEGMTYAKIAKEMGWDDAKGMRPYRIVKKAEA